MLLIFAGVLAATVRMFVIVPKGFIPDQDNDSMNINLRAAQGMSLRDGEERQAGGRDREPEPYVDTFFVSTGGARAR
jgi:multidrug efflux pump subunit AcrB